MEKGQAKWGQVSNLPPLGFRGCLIEEAFGGVMRGGACRCELADEHQGGLETRPYGTGGPVAVETGSPRLICFDIVWAQALR